MTNQYCFLRIQAAPYPFSASHILIQLRRNVSLAYCCIIFVSIYQLWLFPILSSDSWA
ncbi:hypothetical protein CsSME_00041033 [Camellia sinensis var. sinensis]